MMKLWPPKTRNNGESVKDEYNQIRDYKVFKLVPQNEVPPGVLFYHPHG